MTDKRPDICVIMVTYNRKKLLLESLSALLNQSCSIRKIILIDNASTDGTEEALQQAQIFDRGNIEYHRLDKNYGGAGGFHFGVKKALGSENQWLFLIDDDAMAQPDTIENLSRHLKNKNNIYAPIALDRDREHICWPLNHQSKRLSLYSHINKELIETTMAPFLGFTIHTSLIKQIGLPDKDFFISGDDVEYGNRVLCKAGHIYIVTNSILIHPVPPRYTVNISGLTFNCLKLDPWRRYYDIRNRLLIAKSPNTLNIHLLTTLLVILSKLVFTLIFEKQRLLQIKAYSLGIFHGIQGKKGKRIEPGQL